MTDPRPATFPELLLAIAVLVGLGVIIWVLAHDKNIMDD